MDEYQAKGREESANWGGLETAVGESSFRVSDADLASGAGGVTLRVQGVLDDTDWYELYIHGEQLAVHRSDGGEFELEELCRLGEGYWDQFPGS